MNTTKRKLIKSPSTLKADFLALKTPQEIADLLEIDLNRLYFHIYVVSEQSKYRQFQIPKRDGSTRTISAPATALKIIQEKLASILNQVYVPKPCVHSYVSAKGRGIKSNAKVHAKHKVLLSIDLEEFFPSINFGRVRGLFMGKPFRLHPSVATILAQICCFDNQLPQGAPTSPIISNMICAKLDSELLKLSTIARCYYTRYADDVTFSTNQRFFQKSIATFNPDGILEIGSVLRNTIESNGFKINEHKTKLRNRYSRQEVTGLVVNVFPNVKRDLIKQVRCMLHAAEKFGLVAAEATCKEKYYTGIDSPHWHFVDVLAGKIQFIGMIRGKTDPVYIKLATRLLVLSPKHKGLLPKIPIIPPEKGSQVPAYSAWISTEGKSDWKHLKAAYLSFQQQGKFKDILLNFDEFDDDRGATQLLNFCATVSKVNDTNRILIFDRDRSDINAKHTESDGYKKWGNKLYSFLIPVPNFREFTEISIEFLYKDAAIKAIDKNHRRLFISNEFSSSGRLKENDNTLICHQLEKIRKTEPSIIDSSNGVFDDNEQNVALSKDAYAKYVLQHEVGFLNDFTEFSPIFTLIEKICAENL